ncbi:MAG: translation initiation factor IF-2 subunit beta [Candidatus Aenigmarchaeota archaeon]|nr:translation initiation factor IF-2 subunit beta [Candidatus Aenigmarchaeota archaeon]
MNYEELLTKAFDKLPKLKDSGERFEIPKADVMTEGNQTIIKNFGQIATTLRREPEHLLKFLTKELAAPGAVKQQRAVFMTKLTQSAIQQKIETYVRDYVICKECKRPDTKLVKENRITILVCEACGAKYGVKG